MGYRDARDHALTRGKRRRGSGQTSLRPERDPQARPLWGLGRRSRRGGGGARFEVEFGAATDGSGVLVQ